MAKEQEHIAAIRVEFALQVPFAINLVEGKFICKVQHLKLDIAQIESMSIKECEQLARFAVLSALRKVLLEVGFDFGEEGGVA